MILKTYFPQKKEWWTFTKIAIPTILGALLFSVNSIIDNVMAGRLSENTTINAQSMTAIALFSNVSTVYQAILGAFVGVGSTLLVQYSKTKNKAKIRNILKIIWLITLLLFLFLYLLNFLLIRPVIGAQTNDSVVIDKSETYSRIVMLALLFNFLRLPILNLLTAQGKTKYVLIYSLAAVTMNISLNILFIYVWSRSLFSLAIATFLASGIVTSILMVIIFILDKDMRMKFTIYFDREVLQFLWKRCLVPAIFGVWSTIMIFRQVIWTYGDPWNNNIESAKARASVGGVQAIFTSLTQAGTPIIAYFVASKLGTNQINEAKRNAKKVIGYMLTLSIIVGLLISTMRFWVFKTHLFKISESYIDTGKDILTILGIGTISFTIQGVFGACLDAGGRNNIKSIVTIILGASQTLWALLFVMLHKHYGIISDFTLNLAIFYLFEIINIIVFAILYKKTNWAQSFTIKSEKTKMEIKT